MLLPAGLKIAGLVAALALLGKWGIPHALELIAKTCSHELFTLAVLVLAVGIAVAEEVLESSLMACDIAAGHCETIRRILYDAPQAA